MKDFSVYDTSTGRILRSGSCQPITFETQAEAGQAVIEGAYDPDRFDVVDGVAVPRVFSPEEDQEQFEQQRKFAALKVNQRIGNARKKFITDIPGQEAVYTMKRNEAQAFLARPLASIKVEEFPLLHREVGITAASTTELANLWMTMSDQWQSIAADLEEIRLMAQKNLSEATTQEELDMAVSDFETALNASPHS